jgi:hypothetical protein
MISGGLVVSHLRRSGCCFKQIAIVTCRCYRFDLSEGSIRPSLRDLTSVIDQVNLVGTEPFVIAECMCQKALLRESLRHC